MIDGVKSSVEPVVRGLPQGSVLGPILYMIYVNDLPHVTDLFSVCLFADDTTLIFESSNNSELSNKCNAGVALFNNWCCANRLSINFKKTYIMYHKICI